MVKKRDEALAYKRGIFRYGIISELLSCPPNAGELATRLEIISERSFIQPWDQKAIKISIRTLERWYSVVRKAERPSEILQPKLRCDKGKSRSISKEHSIWLADYRLKFPSWSVQLLFDNLILSGVDSKYPSYSSILRYLKREGFVFSRSIHKFKNTREIRTFEVEFVGQMWHMDFHKSTRMIVTEDGEYRQPICMAIIDDKSRLVCHAQWFLNETSEVLSHGFIQAVLKRGLPRTFYTDNGSAMKAEEFISGLIDLNIKQENTLPYAPYQNGKQEAFWQPLEGRLIKMLAIEKRITLDILNSATQAWIEQDYHIKKHSETKETPFDRFFNSKHVLRPSPEYNDLKCSFRMKTSRTLRKTDCSITLDGVRFQIPQHYSHIKNIPLRYARWDLGEAEILCPDTNKSLCKIYPLNRIANSYGGRKEIKNKNPENLIEKKKEDGFLDLSTDQLPPLLAHCLKKHAQEYPFGSHISLLNKKE
jgi:putative transposase